MLALRTMRILAAKMSSFFVGLTPRLVSKVIHQLLLSIR
jgi:hypothetical protein